MSNYRMTEEKYIEELLFESHSLGVYIDVMDAVQQLRYENPDMDRVTMYEKAFTKVVAEKV